MIVSQDPKTLLESGLLALGLAAPEGAVQKTLEYLTLLQKWNQVYNLTAITDPVEAVIKHALDALSVAQFITRSPIVDVGSGGGIPGVLLALFLPQYSFVLLDKSLKKTRFLREVVLKLSLKNVEVVESRLESYQPESPFKIVITRALMEASRFIQLSRALCDWDGEFLLMKGKMLEAELALLTAPYVLHPLKVPFLNEERHLLSVKNS